MRMLLEFRKGDTIRYLGLLDLQRTMQRALRRSGLPIAYSNGFNPHIVMAFASALSSGIPGDAELLDVTLAAETDEETCLAAMRRALPPDLAPVRVRLVDDHFPKPGRLLKRAGYRFTMKDAAGDALLGAIEGFLSQGSIMALRKSKTQEVMVDIRPMIHFLAGVQTPEERRIEAVVSFTEEATLKPDLLMGSLAGYAGIEVPPYRVRRTGLYTVEHGRQVPVIEAAGV